MDELTRRRILLGMSALPLLAPAALARPESPWNVQAPRRRAISLPDRGNFPFDGVYLNGAYVHPMGLETYRTVRAIANDRMHEVGIAWPDDNPRDHAVRLFARLINADPRDIAVVPSTMEGENLIVAALRLGPGTRVVSDAYHFSLAIYRWLHRTRGVPLAVAAPRNNRIGLADIDALIIPGTRLVAVTLVGADTGFTHDLTALCDRAHAKGALVHADIIQAAGAIPIDVKRSGVDFCCAGTYKWMMGAFGTAFLYVRPDRLRELERSQVGWRQFSSDDGCHLRADTAGTFEVSTPNWCGLAAATSSLSYVLEIGVQRIARHREPMIRRLQEELPRYGFVALTPPDSPGPIVSFSRRDAATRLAPRLQAARVRIRLEKDRIRISPSVYNDMEDIERLIRVLAT